MCIYFISTIQFILEMVLLNPFFRFSFFPIFSSFAGFYLTDGSDITDDDEEEKRPSSIGALQRPAKGGGSLTSGQKQRLPSLEVGGSLTPNTQLMLQKFEALLQFNRRHLQRQRRRLCETGTPRGGNSSSGFVRSTRATA